MQISRKVRRAVAKGWTQRQDMSAGLRDAPVPVHACINHIVDGRCSLCGGEVVDELRARVDAMMPKPRRPIVDKMCSSCPFRPDGGAPKLNVPIMDMIGFRRQAEVGEFYCHETVLEDCRTVVDAGGDAVGVQPHFEVCRGGWEHKRAIYTEKLKVRSK